MANKRSWEDMMAKSRKVVDGLGMPIDPGIIETVAILRLMGINTVMSCEGHMDRGYGPYVTFEHKDADADRKKSVQVARQFKGERSEINYAKRKIISKIARDDIAQRRILLPYLDEFYANHATPQSQRLIVENLGFGAAILRCQNAILVGVSSGEAFEAREHLLYVSQNEMKAFTNFLKNRVF